VLEPEPLGRVRILGLLGELTVLFGVGVVLPVLRLLVLAALVVIIFELGLLVLVLVEDRAAVLGRRVAPALRAPVAFVMALGA